MMINVSAVEEGDATEESSINRDLKHILYLLLFLLLFNSACLAIILGDQCKDVSYSHNIVSLLSLTMQLHCLSALQFPSS
jgi:hypothetical protein